MFTNIYRKSRGREFYTTKKLQTGGEKTFAFDVTQKQREEELIAMLQELTPENPRKKMRTKTDLKANTVKVTAASTSGSVY